MGGFHTSDPEGALANNVGANAPVGSSTMSIDPKVPIHQLTLTELIPQEITIQAAEDFVLTDLPAGSRYDDTTKKLIWLPRKGQAGNYAAKVSSKSGKLLAQIRLALLPVTDAKLLSGPADGSTDGDVGYVFIHGKGDVDRCADKAELLAYWAGTEDMITRRPELSTLTCYDGRKTVEEVAVGVAEQILAANCGRFEKCLLVTHSMGGLVSEFIMNHTRAAKSSDPEPELFNNAALFQKVKERTLGVISIATAAGGSKVASILADPEHFLAPQTIVGVVAKWLGSFDGSAQSVAVNRASVVLAPISENPGVPFYMVAGYSIQTAGESDAITGGILDSFFDSVPIEVFQSDASLAKLDAIVQFDSRGDGLVDFRSSCGIMSANVRDGYGYKAPLEQHLRYCYQSEKKHNHQVWFLSNLNHFLLTTNWEKCNNRKNPCVILEPNSDVQSFVENVALRGQSAMAVMRAKLDAQRKPVVTNVVSLAPPILPPKLGGI